MPSCGMMEDVHKQKVYMNMMSTMTCHSLWIQCSLCHMGTESHGPTMCERSAAPKASMKCVTSLWVTEAQQPQETMSSVQSRVPLVRKKTMAFWGTHMNKECYNIHPYWYYFAISANHLWWKSWHRRKGKHKENYSFLYILSYLLVNWR